MINDTLNSPPISAHSTNDNAALDHYTQLLRGSSDHATIIAALKQLGELPPTFDGDVLLPLLNHPAHKIRWLAVKNLAKLKQPEYSAVLFDCYQHEQNTAVRREMVAAIGRMHDRNNTELLVQLLNDDDPKIVCQAIRGLLVFADDETIAAQLTALIDHPNEQVRSVIKHAFDQPAAARHTLPHPVTYDYLKNVVINGDVLQVLAHVPNESVHLTFTSPPYYNARDYAIYPSYQHYLEFLARVFQEIHRITKEGRFLIVNTSPIIIPRVSRAHASKRYPIPFDVHHYLMHMGWEFIDDIVWLKPESSVKNRGAGFGQHRKPIAYKPNAVTEYLMVYRKQTDQLLDWNIRSYSDDIVAASRVPDGYETTNAWKIAPCADQVHSAVFPAELCKRVIQYYSFVGDLVFDPFAGSGTVGTTAQALGRHFLLTEMNATYFAYIANKLRSGSLLPTQPATCMTLAQFREMTAEHNGN